MSADDTPGPASGSVWSAAFADASVDAMRVYDAIVARLFTPWAHDLVTRLAPRVGSEVLDIACGPGTVTHVIAERIGQHGRVIATDLSPAMLAIARSKPSAPGAAPVEWREAPAAPLPLPDSSVDVVTCQQGLQFFPDKVAALSEMRRVLRDGGRAGVATWTRVEDQVFGTVYRALAAVLTPETAQRYLGPFQLGGAEAAAHARAAGFETVEVEQVTLPAVLPGGAQELFDTLPASGIASAVAELDDARRRELLEEIIRLTEPIRDGVAVRGTMTATVMILS